MSPSRIAFHPRARRCLVMVVGLVSLFAAGCNETPTPSALDGVENVSTDGGDTNGDTDAGVDEVSENSADETTTAETDRSSAAIPSVATDGALRAEITRVPDGDSFEAIVDGRDERVRMIGMNTPEGDECFGEEAGDELRRLIDDRTVDLVTPLGERDDFGRILAYVVADGQLVNALLVRDGFALARDQSGHKLADDFEILEADARGAERGVWSPSACGAPISTSVTFGDFEPNAPGPDDENLNGEWIEIFNGGSDEAELGGWTVKDESTRHRYVFNDGVVLGAGDIFRLHTGCGDDDTRDLFWCDETSVWNNGGDTAFLLDPNGNIVDSISYS